MRALINDPEPFATSVKEVNTPALRPTYILVKTSAVALNPTDWKHTGFVKAPVTVGCDYSGTVADVGKDVSLPWKKGVRVFGVVHGSNESQTGDGSFAEYVLAKGDLQLKTPEGLSDEEAATLGMGISTVGQGMYQALGLPLPGSPAKEKFPVLIYGGSSAMGAYGIQFAKASGLEVITTASKHNFDYVKALGASQVFDYKSPTCGADIRKATNNKLYVAWDAIGEKSSANICGEALSSDASAAPGGQILYATTLGSKVLRDDVVSRKTMMYTTFGEAYTKGGRETPASKEDFEYMKKFVAISQKLVDDGVIKPHRLDVRKGGLDGISGGLSDMKEGKVSAAKLVYKL